MKILKQTIIENPLWAIIDKYCPECYPDKECGMVDGGLVHDGDMVEFYHQNCGFRWIENISINR